MRRSWFWLLGVVGILFISCLLSAQDENKYVGVDKCKLCHRIESKGNQYGKWKSLKHSKAYINLASDKAKEVAARLGLTEEPQTSGQCLRCHSTAFDVSDDMIVKGNKLKLEDGVQCEACHGAGGKYWPMTIMKNHELSVANGLREINQTLCAECHNQESPTHTGFDYDQQYKIIAHPHP